jgi:hypothetical protein
LLYQIQATDRFGDVGGQESKYMVVEVRMNKINKKIKYLRVNQKDGWAEGRWSLRGGQQATRLWTMWTKKDEYKQQ